MTSTNNQYKNYEVAPRELTEEEIINPQLVLGEFFDNYHLPEARELHWDFLTSLVIGDYHNQDISTKLGFALFYKQLGRLIEAAHLIYITKDAR